VILAILPPPPPPIDVIVLKPVPEIEESTPLFPCILLPTAEPPAPTVTV
jgi:hypothetical protein